MNNTISKQKKKTLDELLEKVNPIYQKIFKELKKFHTIYEEYARKGWEKSLTIEGKKAVKDLARKLESTKKAVLYKILNEQDSVVQNFKENLKKNLYKSTINLKEKSKINKIIQKENFTEQDKEEQISILSKLPEEELNSLLEDSFNNFI